MQGRSSFELAAAVSEFVDRQRERLTRSANSTPLHRAGSKGSAAAGRAEIAMLKCAWKDGIQVGTPKGEGRTEVSGSGSGIDGENIQGDEGFLVPPERPIYRRLSVISSRIGDSSDEEELLHKQTNRLPRKEAENIRRCSSPAAPYSAGRSRVVKVSKMPQCGIVFLLLVYLISC